MTRRPEAPVGGAIIWTIALIVWGCACVHAQGFLVRPMTIDLHGERGAVLEREIEILNTSQRETDTVVVRAAALLQTDFGTWLPHEQEGVPDIARPSSCLDWSELSATRLRLRPMESGKVTLTVRVPHAARGSYGAMLAVQSEPREGAGMIALAVRFLIPVFVHVRGPSARRVLEPAGLGMVHRPARDDAPATTQVFLEVANKGETLSRAGGHVEVYRQAGDQWRWLCRADVTPRRILRGMSVKLPGDLQRRLPSGRYRLMGVLALDGRRTRTLTAEVDFEGDPTVTDVAGDVALGFTPPSVEVQAVPGSVRSVALLVQNPSREPLEVRCGVATPDRLQGVMMGETKGEDFSCAPWTQVTPSEFTLAPGGQRNLRVMVSFPPGDGAKANHYADLEFAARHTDGESAGTQRVRVRVQNRAATPSPLAQGISLTTAEDEESKYAVLAQFGNFGDMHFTASCQALLTTLPGVPVVSAAMEPESTMVLPLGTPQFSGVLNLSGVPAGTYYVQATLRSSDGEVSARQRIPVRVEVEDERRTMEVISPEEAEQTEEEDE